MAPGCHHRLRPPGRPCPPLAALRWLGGPSKLGLGVSEQHGREWLLWPYAYRQSRGRHRHYLRRHCEQGAARDRLRGRGEEPVYFRKSVKGSNPRCASEALVSLSPPFRPLIVLPPDVLQLQFLPVGRNSGLPVSLPASLCCGPAFGAGQARCLRSPRRGLTAVDERRRVGPGLCRFSPSLGPWPRTPRMRLRLPDVAACQVILEATQG